jgi:flagellar basal-body rod protein FlgB
LPADTRRDRAGRRPAAVLAGANRKTQVQADNHVETDQQLTRWRRVSEPFGAAAQGLHAADSRGRKIASPKPTRSGNTEVPRMYSSMFQSTTIPMLQEVVKFAEARHTVLAGNIANLDTPGYKVRDLSVEDFQGRLKEAIQQSRQPAAPRSPGETNGEEELLFAKVAKDSKSILRHDQSNVGLEYQVTEMAKNQMQHNLAMSLMTSQFHMLRAAISGQV